MKICYNRAMIYIQIKTCFSGEIILGGLVLLVGEARIFQTGIREEGWYQEHRPGGRLHDGDPPSQRDGQTSPGPRPHQ